MVVPTTKNENPWEAIRKDFQKLREIYEGWQKTLKYQLEQAKALDQEDDLE